MFLIRLLILTVCAAGLPAGAPVPQLPGAQAGSALYVCPMHPDITASAPGTCPRCGMALTLMDPFDAREYLVDVATTPPAVRAGAPFTLQLTVREPRSKAVVPGFATVHEKRFHLFVISHDLEHYQHVHPEQRTDGSWALDVTVPAPGFYKLYADFLPVGGSPQVVALPLVTGGYTGHLAGSGARLTPDTSFVRQAGSMRAELVLPDTPLVAGREEMFALDLTDRASGQPVGDLEPYLAAWGHALLLSDDTLSVVHAHPVELVPVNDPAARGGPIVTFKALFPKAANYRLWVQLKRRGEIDTVAYTLNVQSPTAR